MKTLPIVFIGACLSLLAACQSSPVTKDVRSPRFAPPVGSTLVLHTPLDFTARQLGVIIQDGKIKASLWSTDSYYPNCDFELREKPRKPVQIVPDRFRIIRVHRDIENVMLRPTTVAGIDFSGAPPDEEYQTIMYLHSDKQPNVFRMTCKQWEDPSTEGEHVSIEDIRKTLGDIFSLELPGGK